jgi:DNA-binding MurR/RpiR family transcriptional regulator
MSDPTHLSELIRSRRDELSPAERRVADVVIADPQLVAFGTVAELAERSGTSGASVVRLAARLGLEGFSALQSRVQSELTSQIHQASQRIRRPPADDLLARAADQGVSDVQRTLGSIRREDFDAAVTLLADPGRHVYVLASEASRGVGLQFSSELHMVRDRVTQVDGTPVAVHRTLADVAEDDVVVALDLPRYDRWLLDAARTALSRGATLLALTDSLLSPLAAGASLVFVVGSEGSGPFDSHVASLATFETLVAGVAAARRGSAADHLGRIDAAWSDAGVLDDD